ncbi:hypothetical protein [Pantoea sp.]|nr:hypothetical protein [Pantoea sp.]MDU5475892.1 hypothetical protein [Pantoea sp.]
MIDSVLIQLAIAYADSVNSIVDMLCVIIAAYVVNRIRDASQRG